MLKSYLNSVVLALALTPLVAAADVNDEELLIHELNTTFVSIPDACLDASPGYATPTATAQIAQAANDNPSDRAAAQLTPELATVVADACIDASAATFSVAPRIASMQ